MKIELNDKYDFVPEWNGNKEDEVLHALFHLYIDQPASSNPLFLFQQDHFYNQDK